MTERIVELSSHFHVYCDSVSQVNIATLAYPVMWLNTNPQYYLKHLCVSSIFSLDISYFLWEAPRQSWKRQSLEDRGKGFKVFLKPEPGEKVQKHEGERSESQEKESRLPCLCGGQWKGELEGGRMDRSALPSSSSLFQQARCHCGCVLLSKKLDTTVLMYQRNQRTTVLGGKKRPV